MCINRWKDSYTLPTAIQLWQSHSRQDFSVAVEEVEGYASQETEPENTHLVTLDFPWQCQQQVPTALSFSLEFLVSHPALCQTSVALLEYLESKLALLALPCLGLRNFLLLVLLLWRHFISNHHANPHPPLASPWNFSFLGYKVLCSLILWHSLRTVKSLLSLCIFFMLIT